MRKRNKCNQPRLSPTFQVSVCPFGDARLLFAVLADLCCTKRSDLKELLPLLPLLVAVTGKAYTDSPLNCELSKQKAVITRVST